MTRAYKPLGVRNASYGLCPVCGKKGLKEHMDRNIKDKRMRWYGIMCRYCKVREPASGPNDLAHAVQRLEVITEICRQRLRLPPSDPVQGEP